MNKEEFAEDMKIKNTNPIEENPLADSRFHQITDRLYKLNEALSAMRDMSRKKTTSLVGATSTEQTGGETEKTPSCWLDETIASINQIEKKTEDTYEYLLTL